MTMNKVEFFFCVVQGRTRRSGFRVMGDSSSARNGTSGDDPQFDADLELATRLSLETYEHEKRRRSTLPDQSFLSHQNSGNFANLK